MVWAFIIWLFGVGPVLFVVALGIGGGLTLALAPQIKNIRLAHWFFGFAWVWEFGGILEAVGGMKLSPKISFPIVFVCGGSTAVLFFLTFLWVERNHQESVASQIASTTTPSAQTASVHQSATPISELSAPRVRPNSHPSTAKTQEIHHKNPPNTSISPEPINQWPAFMELDAFLPVQGFSTIAPGLQLKFNTLYTNRGALPLHDIYMIESFAITDKGTDETTIETLFTNAITDELKKAKANGYRGTVAGVDRTLNHPFDFNPLTERDANGILDGSRILYLSTYVQWVDIDGKPGSERHCYWMNKPTSNVLTDQQIWNNCLK